jgi:hypothetical protein
MKKAKYNGWANYETWAVKLWLDNVESDYSYWTEQAEENYREFHEQDPKTAVSETAGALAEMLRHQLRGDMPELGSTLWADLLSSALSEVDWFEIGQAYARDAAEAVLSKQ